MRHEASLVLIDDNLVKRKLFSHSKLLKILGFRDVKLTVEATTARGVMVKVSHTVSMLTSEGEKDDMLESLVKSKVKKSEED